MRWEYWLTVGLLTYAKILLCICLTLAKQVKDLQRKLDYYERRK